MKAGISMGSPTPAAALLPPSEPASGVSLAAAMIHLLRRGSLRSIKRGMARLSRAGCPMRPRQMVLVLSAEIHWAAGEHEEVRAIARVLVRDYASSHGYYFLAHSHHVTGDTERAFERLEMLIERYPKHVDGHCLHSRCAAETNRKELAWNSLEAISRRIFHPRIWTHLALLVENDADHSRMVRIHRECRAAGLVPPHHRSVVEALAAAALRCGNAATAKDLWRGYLPHAFSKRRKTTGGRPCRGRYTNCRAATALLDLRRTLAREGICMFLVSGTLLGCIREGRLLGHDKDIDVGIWEDVPPDKLHAALRRAGLFESIPSRSPHIVRVRHVNGIPLDIFHHFREPDTCWHGGIKMRWHNTPFGLRTVPFLGAEFLIPENHERYLSENYGDWETPKIAFDSAFDTPNGEVADPDEMLVHTFKSLAEAQAAGRPAMVHRYFERLEAMGESAVVAACRETRAAARATA
jgi:hypothetical protein